MNAYVEVVFIENFIVELTLVKLSAHCLNFAIDKRGYIVCIIYSMSAIALSLFIYSRFTELVLKAVLGIIVCLLSHKGNKSSQMQLIGLYFFFLMTLMGLSTLFPISNWLVGVTLLLLSVTVKWIKRQTERQITINTFSCNCSLCNKGEEERFQGFIDTGNAVSYRGNPVHMVDKNACYPFLIVTNAKRVGAMSIRVVNGINQLELFEIDRLQVYFGTKVHTIEKCIVGICERFSDEYQILLHPCCLREVYEVQGTAFTDFTKVEHRGKFSRIRLRK